MRSFEERKAEVFRRSENRIKKRKRNRNLILTLLITLCLIVTVWSVTILPSIFSFGTKKSQNDDTVNIFNEIEEANEVGNSGAGHSFVLIDVKGKGANSEHHSTITDTAGFCVKGEDTAKFLENSLQKLGLNRKEANEFIVYWLPLMGDNPYNIISFQTNIYTDAAKLNISPPPDTLIRVFMAWKSSENYVELPVQQLTAPERNGFTVVEWGGTD